MKNPLTTLPAFGALLLACSSAGAAITIYSDEASFLAAISAPATDSFDDLGIGSVLGGPIARTAGPYGYSANTAPGATLFIAGAGADAWLSTNTALDSIVALSFTGGVQAAGGFFFGSDFDGIFAPADIRVSASEAGSSASKTIAGATTGSFLGFVSSSALTGLEVVALQPTTGFLWPTINDLTLGRDGGGPTVVPLPGAFALMAPTLLLAGLLAGRRRRA